MYIYIYIKRTTVFSRPRGKKKRAPTPRIRFVREKTTRKYRNSATETRRNPGYKRVSTAISTGLSLSLSLVYHSWKGKGKGGRDACGQNRKNRVEHRDVEGEGMDDDGIFYDHVPSRYSFAVPPSPIHALFPLARIVYPEYPFVPETEEGRQKR